jgi:agmatine/peptidylarginine deiminase
MEIGEVPLSCVNWHHANGGLVVPRHDDISGKDEASKQKLQRLFPELQIKQVHILHTALIGGGIHCMA